MTAQRREELGLRAPAGPSPKHQMGPICRRTLAATLALALACSVSAFSQEEAPSAPDGRPSLAWRGGAQELGRVLVRPRTAEEKQLAADLLGIEAAVKLRLSLATRELRSRGCMALIEDTEGGSFLDVAVQFEELFKRASTELAVGDERARGLGVCLLDPAFGVRFMAIKGIEEELSEVRSGLAILVATQVGYASLRDDEALSLAQRVDRSAALLRSMMLDLDLLDASDYAGEPVSSAAVKALTEAARQRGQEERERSLSALLDPTQAVIQRMAGSLKGVRLRSGLAGDLALRDAARARALLHSEELDRIVPGRLPDEDVPAEVLAMSKQDRYRVALRHAEEGLAEDPFSSELTFYMALSTDWLADRVRSRPWFDRFLALKGVRAHDHRTYQGKELSTDVQIALDAVQSNG